MPSAAYRRVAHRRAVVRRRRTLAAVVVVVAAIIALTQGGATPRHVANVSATGRPPGSGVTDPPVTRVAPTTTTAAPRIKSSGPFAVGVTTLTVADPTDAALSLSTVVRYPAAGSPGGGGVGASPDQADGPYPLLVFSQGFDISPESYSALLASWASAGYVVADPTYPFTTPGAATGLNENDIVRHPADLSSVISGVLGAGSQPGSVLSGLTDPTEVGAVGHSDGGDVTFAAVANTCCRDPRIKAAAILSGAELTSFPGTYSADSGLPLLVVQGTADVINVPACSEQIYNVSPPPKYFLSLVGAPHEDPYIVPGGYQSVVEAVTTDFWNGYLKHRTGAVAALPAAGSSGSIATLTTAPAVPQGGSCPGSPS